MPQPKSFHYAYIIVACCCLIMGIDVGLMMSCAGIFYEPVCKDLGITVGKLSWYMSFSFLTSSLMLPLAGKLMERYSARLLLTLNSAILGVAMCSMAFYTRVWEFYVAGAVMGATLAFLLYLSFPTMINRWFHSRVGVYIGICSAASGIGGIVFNPVGGWLITTYGWRVGYAAFGLMVLCIVTPLIAILLRDYPHSKGLTPVGEKAQRASAPDSTPQGISYGRAVKMPVFYILILFAFLIMAISTIFQFIPAYVQWLGYSIDQGSFAASAAMGGVTIGKVVLGAINDRNCRMGVVFSTLPAIIGMIILTLGVGGIYMMIVGSFLFGWCYAAVTVQTTMLVRKVFGSLNYARIYSNISIALAAGGALASGGWGWLSDTTTPPMIFIVGAVLLAVCAFLGLFSLRGTAQDKL